MPKPYRLILGDARVELAKLLDCSVDLIVTDPPYGHNNNSNDDLIHVRERALGEKRRRIADKRRAKKNEMVARPIANDGPEANQLLKDVLPEFKRLLRPGCCCCCCCSGGGPDPQFARWSLWIAKVLDFKQMIIVDKGKLGMGWHYRRSYETVLVSTKPGAKCRWYDKSDRVENIIRPGQYGIRKLIPGEHDHPCAKPVELAAHFIRLHTKPGDTILDPFAGAGWVGEACLKLGRKFIGIEVDPHWYNVACKRLGQVKTGFGLLGKG